MKRVILIISSLVLYSNIVSQCFSIESILADACGNPEGENEMVLLRINQTINDGTLIFNWPSNSYLGWCGNATLTAQLNQTIISSCGLLLEPPFGIVPANCKLLVVSSSNMLISANSFSGLTDTIYIIYQCAGNTVGHFSNSASTLRTLQVSCSGSCTHSQSVSYLGTNLIGGDGAAIFYDVNGDETYYNTGCNAPVPNNNPNWDFPKTICSDKNILDLNDFVSQNTPQNGTWSGDIENGHFFNPESKFGTYSITYTVVDPGSCVQNSDSTINVFVSNPSFGPDTVVVCDSIRPYQNWLYEDTTIYVSISSQNDYNCDSTIVRFYDIIKADYSLNENSVDLRSGETYEFEIIGEGNYTYSFTSEFNENCSSPCFETLVKPKKSDIYNIDIIDIDNGCNKKLPLNIDIVYFSKVEYPNIFTPNNDGENDFFKIYGEDLEKIEFYIYSKWGEQVFHGIDLNSKWDGNFKNIALENASYLLQIKGLGKDGIEYNELKNISLIR